MSHVPIPDRRHAVRIVTLKNFGVLLLVAIAMLVALELVVRVRRPETTDYGRIIDQQTPAEAVARPAPEVVTEGAITDQTAVDPQLLAPLERSQYLDLPVVPAPMVADATVAVVTRSPIAAVRQGAPVAAATSTGAPAALLSGGTFKERQ